MSNHAELTSRVLVLDEEVEHIRALKRFCAPRHLELVRVPRGQMSTALRGHVELGAIVLSETYGGSVEATAELAGLIRSIRPEIPLILRRQSAQDLSGLPERLREASCVAYRTGDWDNLQHAVNDYIFSLVYPNTLVRGISEISEATLRDRFGGLELEVKTPCLSRDRIIFGEVLSLIPLESAWCRGYMMLQLGESGLLQFLNLRYGQTQSTFHAVNNALSETTNLIWGGIKSRFIGDDSIPGCAHVQVPIVVNHQHRYISFGAENPQLCFQYRLRPADKGFEVVLNQRFVFSLNWSPDEFREVKRDVRCPTAIGELELF